MFYQEEDMPKEKGLHPSHVTRISIDASSFDYICDNCGATDEVPGGWGALDLPCPNPKPKVAPEPPTQTP